MVTFIKSKKFLLILFLLFFISSSTALALELDWPRTPRPGGITLTDDSDVGDMVQYFYEWAIILGGLTTFVSLVSAGFKYLSSMGRPEAMKEARSQITSAFAGLVLLLSAWLILNIINPELTTFRRTSFNLKFSLEKYTSLVPEELPGCDYVILYYHEEFAGGEIPIPGKEPDTKLIAYYMGRSARSLQKYPGFKETYMPDGKIPAKGEIFKNPDLANTLELIGKKGRDEFYKGSIAKTIAKACDSAGSAVHLASIRAAVASID